LFLAYDKRAIPHKSGPVRVLSTAKAAGTNGLTCTKHAKVRDKSLYPPIRRLSVVSTGYRSPQPDVNLHIYHSRFILEGVAEVSQIFLRDTHVLPKLVSYEEHCRRDKLICHSLFTVGATATNGRKLLTTI
jgi:hypothetical protein